MSPLTATNPPNVYGFGHETYYRNVLKVLRGEAMPDTDGRAGRKSLELILAIYHSHPRSNDPSPSETDVRLAYYPSATYLIVGLGGQDPVVKAFTISEREQRWQQVEYVITD